MKLGLEQLVHQLDQAVALSESDFEAFKKRLTVKHEFESIHGAVHSNFVILYTCPESGLIVSHCDSMLWNDIADIQSTGVEAAEIQSYEANRDFYNNHSVKHGAPDGDYEGEIAGQMSELADIYSTHLTLSEFIPDWKNEVVAKFK